MEQMDKPRICEVLGVEVGERFSIDGYPTDYGMVQVCEDGKIRRVVSTQEFPFAEKGEVGHKIGSNALYYLLNHPDRIIRKPRFTEEEEAVLRHMAAAGIKSINRCDMTSICWDTGYCGGMMLVPSGFLPSLRLGQDVVLGEVLREQT